MIHTTTDGAPPGQGGAEGYEMSETKTTPGPWTWSATGEDRTIMAKTAGIGLVVAEVSERTDSRYPGNRALIAAAPEMLAALTAAVERMEAVAEGIIIEKRHKGVSPALHVRHMAGHLAQHAKLARAAIARAEGRE